MYVGIDIGGTKIAGALVGASGQVQHRQEVATPVKKGGPAILQSAVDLARLLKDKCGEPLEGIGIGSGGQIDALHGYVYSATDVLPGYKGLQIKRTFESALGVRTAVDNDVNVLALGELRFGAARRYLHGCVVFLALGTGVGGALLIGGKLHHGAHWSGGEFGHILLSLDPHARKDLGGARGTLEAYCSGSGLVETYMELTGDTGNGINGAEVARRAAHGKDKAAVKAIRKTGEYLGYGLVTLANALDPHIIVVGGGLSEMKEQLLEPARKILQKSALPGPSQCLVVPAELGSEAAIIGAAALVMP
jgi:glucokinase